MKKLTLITIGIVLSIATIAQTNVDSFIKKSISSDKMFEDDREYSEGSKGYLLDKTMAKYKIRKKKIAVKINGEKLDIPYATTKANKGENISNTYDNMFYVSEAGDYVFSTHTISEKAGEKTGFSLYSNSKELYIDYTFVNFFPNETPFKE